MCRNFHFQCCGLHSAITLPFFLHGYGIAPNESSERTAKGCIFWMKFDIQNVYRYYS